MKGWIASEARQVLHSVYAEVDALAVGITCEGTAECCRFGVTGREPYLTAIEAAEILMLRSRAKVNRSEMWGARHPKSLVVVQDDPCPFLSANNTCQIYASRPLGCRTFFCERASDRVDRRASARSLQALRALSEKHFPNLREPRTLRRWLATGLR